MAFRFFKKQQGDGSSVNLASVEADKDQLIEEALTVVNDFLNAGYFAVLSCGDYDGHIIFTPDARNGSKTGFIIIMSDAGDVSAFAKKYPKLLLSDPEMAKRYYEFLDKYQKCYHPSDDFENGYVYRTQQTVPTGYYRQDQLREMLMQQIAQKCPLADIQGGLLLTKNVPRS